MLKMKQRPKASLMADYGRPSIRLHFFEGSPVRLAQASLFEVAGLIERASADSPFGWIVEVGRVSIWGHGESVGLVKLELGEGSPEEKDAAFRILGAVVQQFNREK